MRDYLGETIDAPHRLTAVDRRTNTKISTSKIIKGDLRGRKLRVACEQCNNGWMSHLQNQAKPILLPMMLGTKAVLSPDEQSIISAWMAMFTMVFEQMDPDSAAITKEEREKFKAEKRAQENWLIWIAPYSGAILPATHRGIHLRDKRDPIVGPDIAIPRNNFQFMLVALGRICLLAMSTVPALFLEKLHTTYPLEMAACGFCNIWPNRRCPVAITENGPGSITPKLFPMLPEIIQMLTSKVRRNPG